MIYGKNFIVLCQTDTKPLPDKFGDQEITLENGLLREMSDNSQKLIRSIRFWKTIPLIMRLGVRLTDVFFGFVLIWSFCCFFFKYYFCK